MMKYFVASSNWPGPKRRAAELFGEKSRAGTARPVQDQNGVARRARSVAFRLADRAVMEFQFGQRFAAVEFEVADDEIALGRRARNFGLASEFGLRDCSAETQRTAAGE
jgi:hypothetical protein